MAFLFGAAAVGSFFYAVNEGTKAAELKPQELAYGFKELAEVQSSAFDYMNLTRQDHDSRGKIWTKTPVLVPSDPYYWKLTQAPAAASSRILQ
jgi:hypothetical protein